jgi:hypothetical protein
MSIWIHRDLFAKIAVVLVTLFVAVLFMHVFVSHDHQYESFGSGIVLPSHNAIGEKFFSIAFPASLFIAFATILFVRNIFLETRLRGWKQDPDALASDTLRLLFARGILHSKAY